MQREDQMFDDAVTAQMQRVCQCIVLGKPEAAYIEAVALARFCRRYFRRVTR